MSKNPTEHLPIQSPPPPEAPSGVHKKPDATAEVEMALATIHLLLKSKKLFKKDGELENDAIASLNSFLNHHGFKNVNAAAKRLDCITMTDVGEQRTCLNFKLWLDEKHKDYLERQADLQQDLEQERLERVLAWTGVKPAEPGPVERTPELQALRAFIERCEQEILERRLAPEEKMSLFLTLWDMTKQSPEQLHALIQQVEFFNEKNPPLNLPLPKLLDRLDPRAFVDGLRILAEKKPPEIKAA